MNQERGEDGREPGDVTRVPRPGASQGWPETSDADGSATQNIPRRTIPPRSTPAPAQPPGTFGPTEPPPPASSYRPGWAAPTAAAEPWDETRGWARPTGQDSGYQDSGYEVMYPAAAHGGFDATPPGAGDGRPPEDASGAGEGAGSGVGVEPPTRWRPPRRRVLILTALPLVLILLFVVVDRVTVSVAEGEMAKQLKTSVVENVACGAPPPTVKGVSIGGFPFLTQVLFGKFQNIGVTVEDLSTPQLRIASIQANLKGIHVPLSQIISNNVGEVRVDSAQATVRVRYDDLNTFLASQPGGLRINPKDNGRRVEITGTADVPLLGAQQVGGITTFEVRDNKLILVPTEITLRGLLNLDIPLGGLGELIPSIPIPVGELPFQLDITKASTDASGLSLSAIATNLVLPKAETTPQCKPS
ncbi:LmeA family phospholipid-binding protein [Pseudofrankia sp. BMG5.36]|uniref:LmeA family phospholipid-binding protein n=1 Tax=Pseudofrankia sp. BMG5.36 TaxID=1834512 RepID=UPI0008DAA4B3|nr:LmeA family phospholipid-binding protein [Pseudofrankia sp. BMG5.36]OHV47446.1 hypothetical protein BCD48_19030 [Pseudofrankia sp. BMG5.36]